MRLPKTGAPSIGARMRLDACCGLPVLSTSQNQETSLKVLLHLLSLRISVDHTLALKSENRQSGAEDCYAGLHHHEALIQEGRAQRLQSLCSVLRGKLQPQWDDDQRLSCYGGGVNVLARHPPSAAYCIPVTPCAHSDIGEGSFKLSNSQSDGAPRFWVSWTESKQG